MRLNRWWKTFSSELERSNIFSPWQQVFSFVHVAVEGDQRSVQIYYHHQ